MSGPTVENVARPLGTVRQVETASEVLARLSESSTDGRLRDAIGLVRSELYDLLDEADRRNRKHVIPPGRSCSNEYCQGGRVNSTPQNAQHPAMQSDTECPVCGGSGELP